MQKKLGTQNEPLKTSFLRSVWDYLKMIDYGVAFINSGKKLYLTLINRDICHFFITDLVVCIIDRTMAIFSHKYNLNNILHQINSELAFQVYSQKLSNGVMNLAV